MSRWLLKTEPDCYAWEDLAREKKAAWDGVSNALALKHIRSMKKGDEAIIYHTGTQRAAVGVARIVSDPYRDPNTEEDRLVVVDIKPVKKLRRPVTLGEIKADKMFAGWDLVRISRLSVVPTPDAMWERIVELSEVSE